MTEPLILFHQPEPPPEPAKAKGKAESRSVSDPQLPVVTANPKDVLAVPVSVLIQVRSEE